MTEDNDSNGREDGQEPPRVTDHRKIDPQTGRPRAADPGSGPADSGHEAPQSSDQSGESSPGEGKPAQPRERWRFGRRLAG